MILSKENDLCGAHILVYFGACSCKRRRVIDQGGMGKV